YSTDGVDAPASRITPTISNAAREPGLIRPAFEVDWPKTPKLALDDWSKSFHDVRMSTLLSAFRRRKVIAITMILTVALVTGAGTSVAAFINATLIRPLPYPEADRLVGIHTMPP